MIRCKLRKKRFTLIHSSRERGCNSGEVVVTGDRSRELGDHITIHKHKTEKCNWKYGEAMNPQNLHPVVYFLQQCYVSSPNSATN